jgi:ornithine cyclodeaminase
MTSPRMIRAEEMAAPDVLIRVIDALADAFGDLAEGRTRSPCRTILEHGPDRQLLVAPAIWERRGAGSVKVTTLTPGNSRRGIPLIHGIVVLIDLETGRITAVADGGELTALRTGAVAGLATRLCAPADATDLAVIGAGVQAYALVRAVSAVRPIRSVRVFSRSRARAEEFAERVRGCHPARVVVCASAKTAVDDAEVICTATATSGRAPLVAADWVAPGAHVNVIGGTHQDAIEIDPALLTGAFVIVEERAAALEEAGEVRAALHSRLITVGQLHELGAVVRGQAVADGQTTVFRSVGMAIEDTAAAVVLAETGEQA